MGKYSPENMVVKKMLDYHSFDISLRFIGEYFGRYNFTSWKPNDKIYFGPAAKELYDFKSVSVTESLTELSFADRPVCVQELSEKTMKYYEGAIEKYGVKSLNRMAFSKVSVSDKFQLATEDIVALAYNSSSKIVHPDKKVLKPSKLKQTGDIQDALATTNVKTIHAFARQFSGKYIATWKSVAALCFEVMFEAYEMKETREFLRSRSKLLDKGEIWVKNMLTKVARELPSNIGHMLMSMLNQLTPDRHTAVTEFASMINVIYGRAYANYDDAPDHILRNAIINSNDPEGVIVVIHKGINRALSHVHSAKAIQFKFMPGRDAIDVFTDGVREFMIDRTNYWVNHYSSRLNEFQNYIAELCSEHAKRANSSKGGKFRVAPRWSASYERNTKSDIASMSRSTLEDQYAMSKGAVVLYSFLKAGYKHAEVVISDNFDVSVEIKAPAIREIMRHNMERYFSKRSTPIKAFSVNGYNVEMTIEQLMKYTRITDMTNFLDKTIAIPITDADLFKELNSRLRTKSKSVQKTLGKKFQREDINVVQDLHDEAKVSNESLYEETNSSKDIANAVSKFADANQFAILDVSSESDDDPEEEVKPAVKLTNVPTVTLTVAKAEPDKAATKKNDSMGDLSGLAGMLSGLSVIGATTVKIEHDYKRSSLRDYIMMTSADAFSANAFNSYVSTKDYGSVDLFFEVDELPEAYNDYVRYASDYNKGFQKVKANTINSPDIE
jgi:hypothetical protein